MGLEQTVTFAAGTVPSWAAVQDLLAQRGFSVRLQMIDGQLAFPDEQPPEAWKELRFGTPAGMVTVRRAAERLTLLVWGNADTALLQARNALAWAFAENTNGCILEPAGPLSAAEFARQAALPPSQPGKQAPS